MQSHDDGHPRYNVPNTEHGTGINMFNYNYDQEEQFDPKNKNFIPANYRDLSVIPLEQGTRAKTGKKYDRSVSVAPDMYNLINVVAGMQKDIKRINSCITKDGADAWIAKTNKKNWSSHEEDIIGPNGRPDGINEVFVTDANGNIRVINGYGLAQSQYPQRKTFYTAMPESSDRKAFNKAAKDAKLSTGLTRYNQLMNGFSYDGEHLKYDFDYPEGREFNMARQKRRVPSAKDIFTQYMFDPFYKSNKAAIATSLEKAKIYDKGKGTKGLGQFYLQASNALYKAAILDVTMSNSGITEDSKPSEVTKIKKSKAFKDALMDAINVFYNTLYEGGVLKADRTTAVNNHIHNWIAPIFQYVIHVMAAKNSKQNAKSLNAFRSGYKYKGSDVGVKSIDDRQIYDQYGTTFIPNEDYIVDVDEEQKKDL